jgi:hypothetical protein
LKIIFFTPILIIYFYDKLEQLRDKVLDKLIEYASTNERIAQYLCISMLPKLDKITQPYKDKVLGILIRCGNTNEEFARNIRNFILSLQISQPLRDKIILMCANTIERFAEDLSADLAESPYQVSEQLREKLVKVWIEYARTNERIAEYLVIGILRVLILHLQNH